MDVWWFYDNVLSVPRKERERVIDETSEQEAKEWLKTALRTLCSAWDELAQEK